MPGAADPREESADASSWQMLGFTVEVNSMGIQGTEIGRPSTPTGQAIGESAQSSATAASLDGAVPASSIASPSLLGMAASFATSMAIFAASGFKTVDAATHQVRVDQCASCRYLLGTRCQVCGCFIDKKAWLPHEDCPLGRWPA